MSEYKYPNYPATVDWVEEVIRLESAAESREAAIAEGWRQAIVALRDRSAYEAWAEAEADHVPVTDDVLMTIADYLAAESSRSRT